MIQLEVLKKRGVSREAWQRKYEAKQVEARVEEHRQGMWSRVTDGVANNLGNYKFYHSIDLAWDAPFGQTNPTLLRAFAERLEGLGEAGDVATAAGRERLLKVVRDFGYERSLVEVVDPKTKKRRTAVDVPTFFDVTLPVVRGYVIIRAAKLCNDRALDPFFKYEPLRDTPEYRARAEIVTSRARAMAVQYGYAAVRRAMVLQMLLYGTAFQFIETEWDEEWQLDRREEPRLVKEGLRYHWPHPSRVYWDRAHPVYSLLTDTGGQFAGYWRLNRYRELRQNKRLWNRGRISLDKDWIKESPAFFSTVYPCAMSFPRPDWGAANANDIDRFYSSSNDDAAVMLVEHFEKVIPADCGLGDYEYPVWARFVMAGDGTVVYAAPLPGAPVIPYADILLDSKAMNASLAMEILPIQDAMSNAMSQVTLTAKQNLANLVWVDKNLVTPETCSQLENLGEQRYRKLNFVLYNGREMRGQLADVGKAVTPINLPKMPVAEMINIMNTYLNILERVIQVSAQEVGASAPHEQTAEEITSTKQATSTRLVFSGTPVDWATDAWKRQVYEYLMAFGEAEFYAQLPANTAITPEVLDELGLSYEEHDAKNGGAKFTVTVKKEALALEFFASTKEDTTRTDQGQLAGAMSQVLMALLGNPMMAQALGPDQGVKLFNRVLERMGLPRDFILQNASAGQAAEVMQQVQQALQQQMQEIGSSMQPLIQKTKETAELAQQNSASIGKIVEILSHGSGDSGAGGGGGAEVPGVAGAAGGAAPAGSFDGEGAGVPGGGAGVP